MVIHAVYENGVFRPIQTVELPESCHVELSIHMPPPANSNTSATAPLVNLAAIAAQYPDNPKLPTDLAEHHDHYLYGTPKRS